ncbi:DUF6502 family protein [Variovorax sp. LARHSF232]
MPTREASGALPGEQASWTLAACARVMRPVVRLALALGVKHPQLQRLLRDLLLDEAQSVWFADKGTAPSISQLSVTTGLNRKVITSSVRETRAPVLDREMSAAAKVLTLWLQMSTNDPALQNLAIAGDAPSFENIARLASRGNVHHRAILDELVRLNMASEEDGRAQLNATAFVPSSDLKGMLGFLGDNTGDHLLAAVANTLGAQPALLERSVFVSGISAADCERIHQLARERWGGLHHELTQEMRRAFDAEKSDTAGRIRVGIYAYYAVAAPRIAPVAAPSKRVRRKT